MGMVTSDRFIHFEYFSLVTGSHKPFDSFLTNTRSFQSCFIFSTTSKADWSLNNLENWDNSVVLGTCCIPLSCLTTKTGAQLTYPVTPIRGTHYLCLHLIKQYVALIHGAFHFTSPCEIPCNFTFQFSSFRSFHSSSLSISNGF